ALDLDVSILPWPAEPLSQNFGDRRLARPAIANQEQIHAGLAQNEKNEPTATNELFIFMLPVSAFVFFSAFICG
ncbi:MAG TPA: hypothetical protein VG433_05865, partial [Pirellulales bacterium]|nr:hypothetical protein [Pirellulales bacterium]